MRSGRDLAVAGFMIVAGVLAWLLFFGLPRWYGDVPAGTRAVAAPSATTPLPPGRKIKARLFYVADDGLRLTAAERDVPFGEGTVEQAKEIINVQIAPVAEFNTYDILKQRYLLLTREALAVLKERVQQQPARRPERVVAAAPAAAQEG